MIDTLPLDLFGEDDGESTISCPWCEAVVALASETCPECGARIPPPPPPEPAPADTVCQWCGTTITPGTDNCPSCGWDARGDNETEMPGLTTPLSESEVRTLYGGDDADTPDPDLTDAIGLVGEIISLLLPND